MLIDHSHDVASCARQILRMLQPKTLVGSKKIRLGRHFDGGYVMIDSFDGVEVAYSLGINDDVSWDIDIASRGIAVHQYDPTINQLPRQNPLFFWEPVWIGGVVDKDENVQTLQSLIERNGHSDKRNMILKCDIETHEWPLLQVTPNSVLAQFSQMVLEIHDLKMIAQPDHVENVRESIANLTASHNVVHVHGNNYGGWAIVGGIPLPNVIELTLMRKDMGDFVDDAVIYPTVLDMPCNKYISDMFIGLFRF